MLERRIRVLFGKVGLDSHYRGVQVLSMMLRDAGMEVIYTGLFQTPETIVHTALQEDVDILGLSFLSGEHLVYTEQVINLLKEKGLGDLPVLVGGVMPKEDIPKLKEIGACEVFRADTPMDDIINYIEEAVKERSPEITSVSN
ncbi:MAG: cobalamin B12-binding domain-containing protein [Desulfatiglans sp.]|jgi:methylmalonyl-CoA mutase C-terminal domain/subunit|nr:cobalamin B12-binding domain-containing protein [Thermodesulfobacteriota bacterium]MEE4353151.1 cobalamin B12-binding domain-containing protein [Desulfatiglans sp.]